MRALALVLLAGCGMSINYERLGVRAVAATAIVASACDNRQTVRDLRAYPAAAYETNPALGSHPSTSLLDAALVVNVVLSVVASEAPHLPMWLRGAIVGGIAGIETAAVITNWQYEPYCGL